MPELMCSSRTSRTTHQIRTVHCPMQPKPFHVRVSPANSRFPHSAREQSDYVLNESLLLTSQTCRWGCLGSTLQHRSGNHELEKMDPSLLTMNRYGVQLGDKVPLWGGFAGDGQFSLRLWTPTPKLTREQWTKHIPALKRAVAVPPQERFVKYKIWHDNETLLQVPAAYKRHGLISVRFPPNSGDLNPIETVWARLRRDLGQREREDLKVGRVISHSVFRQRVSQILQSYSKPSGEDRLNFYQRLLRGMPARLSKCRANKYGPCGK